MLRNLALGLSLAVLSCSSGGAGSAGSVSTGSGDISRICTSICAWGTRCSKAEAGCAETCNTNGTKYQGKYSVAFVNHVTACFETLTCSQSDDVCVANFVAVDPAYPEIPEVQACLARRTECASAFADDYCHTITILSASARAEADACRVKPCAEIKTCLVAAGAFNY
jgi:hypothetical protein